MAGLNNIESQISKSFILENVNFSLINSEKNYDMLLNVPYYSVPGMDDIAAIYKLEFPDENGVATMTVNDKVMDQFDITVSELYDAAMNNLQKETISLKSIEDTLAAAMPPEVLEMFGMTESVPVEDAMISVLTTKSGYSGARAILNPEIFSDIHYELGEDFIIIPSSIHEVLIIRDQFATSPEYIKGIVKEVNTNVVDAKDFLSDNIFKYSGAEKEVMTINVNAAELDFGDELEL